MSTATVHTVADDIAETFRRTPNVAWHRWEGRAGVREVVAHHDFNVATVSIELTNGQRFYLTIAEDDES